MRKASLFSGIGGIDLSAHWVGMETVVFCEREPFPQRVLRKHWPDVPIIDDVHDFTREELEKRGVIGDGRTIDIISAGYPCQPFSHAGKRRGTEDDRHLWPEVKRILSEIRPRWFVGENVAGHISLGLDDVLSDLESIGYTAQAFVLPAAAVFASHRRDRVFIVANACGVRWDDWSDHRKERYIQNNINRCSAKSESEWDGRFGRVGKISEAVANACGVRWEECNSAAITDQSGLNSRCGNAGNETLADANDERREECHTPAISEGLGQRSRGNHAERAHGARRATQSRMGRDFAKLPERMDGGGLNPLDALKDFIANYPQPALFGQPQYDWEPPRVAIGVKNRAARLKALGNAVDPLQIFPIMYAIKVVDDWLREGEA